MANRMRGGYDTYDDVDEYFHDEYRAEQGAYTERRPAYERYGRDDREPRYGGPRLPLGYHVEEGFPRSGTGAPLNSAADRFYGPPERDATGPSSRFPTDRMAARPEPRRREHGRTQARHRGAGLLGAAEHFYRELTEAVDPNAQLGPDRNRHRGRGPRNYVRSDERILEDIHERLTEDPFVDASDIEIHVRDREVTLSGLAASRSERRRAEDIAEDVSGVLHVQNNVRVRS